ncbi:MAG: HAMP domain-containing histidine kinase [Deltaproteobacteria bacterium]|nr:HAMP domain-containing histidine kinase [Deltaproteobacteria bacterium]
MARDWRRVSDDERLSLVLRRMQVGGVCVLAGLLLFAVADWVQSPAHLGMLYLLKSIMAAQVALLLWAMRQPRAQARALELAALSICSLYAIGMIQSTFVIGEVQAAPASFIIISICAAALLPWGATAQAVTVAFGIAMMWINAVVVQGDLAAVLGYLQVAAFIGLAISVYLAAVFERHRLALAQTQADLRHANEVRERFVATMSHELRNAIGAVMGYNDLLLEGVAGPLNEKQAETARRAYECAVEMRDVLTATLDLNRFDARDMRLDLQPVDLNELVAELRGEIVRPPTKPNVQLEWRAAASHPLQTDRLKLKMVLRNLVGNALKFTEQGRVEVDVATDATGAEIVVRDTGAGIPPAALPTLFEPFEQAHGEVSRQHGGAGLGLHIVRQLVDALGGEISAESADGRGTVFRIRLPARP